MKKIVIAIVAAATLAAGIVGALVYANRED